MARDITHAASLVQVASARLVAQAVDLFASALFGDGHQEAIGQFGVPACQRHAGQEAALQRSASSSATPAVRLPRGLARRIP